MIPSHYQLSIALLNRESVIPDIIRIWEGLHVNETGIKQRHIPENSRFPPSSLVT